MGWLHKDLLMLVYLPQNSKQNQKIQTGIIRVASGLPNPPEAVVVSGMGEFLAKSVLDELGWETEVISVRQRIGEQASQSAPAFALAVLATERNA